MTRYLSTSNAAIFLGSTQPTLARWRRQGDGPPFKKIGRRVTYDIAELESWIAERSFRATSQYGAKRRSTPDPN